jgi:hypothetical protein
LPINNNDETAYREEVSTLTTWSQINNPSLDVSKTKKLIVDFRRNQAGHINGAAMEMVNNFKILGVHISVKLKWFNHTDNIVKKSRR